MERFFTFWKPKIYEPRQSEVAAAQAPFARKAFFPSNLDITFFYGPHGDRRDFERLAPYLSQTDIFIPEAPAWTLDSVMQFSRLSQGDRTARKELEKDAAQGRFNPFVDKMTKSLLDSEIRVTPIDYPANDRRAGEILDHFGNWGLLDKIVSSWNKTLDNIVDFACKEGDIESYRDNIMVASIGSRLQTLVDLDPELQQKARVSALVQLGTSHSFSYTTFEAMAAAAESTTIQRIQVKEVAFDHFDQLAHTFRIGAKVTQEERRALAMRALARVALRFNAIPLVSKESDRFKSPPAEEMVERFTIGDVRKFHQQVAERKFGKARN